MGKKNKNKNKESPEDKLYNLQAQQLAAQVANWAAQLEFQKERLRLLELPQFQQGLQLEVDKFAWEKAENAWEQTFKEATLTGTYQGKPTTQWLMDQARLTGSYNGERTLEGKLTDAQIKDMNDKMKLANDQFIAATTGYYGGQKTFDREKFEAAQALEGWKFISTLSGPQNAFKQARAIASMPGGVNQMMDAFAGRYMMPGSSAVGSGGGGNPLDDMRMGWGGMNAGSGGAATGADGPAILPRGVGQQPTWAYQPSSPITNPPQLPVTNPAPFATTMDPTPGRGFAPSQWNAATKAAIAAWEAKYPGYLVDGSAIGYRVRTASDPPAPGTTTTPTSTTTPVSAAPVGGGSPASDAAQAQGYTYQPAGVQAPANQWNYSGTNDGSVQVYPPGVTSPAATADASTTAAINPSSVQAVVNQPYSYGATADTTSQVSLVPGSSGPNYGSMPLPNQINAQNYNNAYQYQRDLMWAAYEDAGWDKSLAQEAYLKSLPKYGGVSKGSVAF